MILNWLNPGTITFNWISNYIHKKFEILSKKFRRPLSLSKRKSHLHLSLATVWKSKKILAIPSASIIFKHFWLVKKYICWPISYRIRNRISILKFFLCLYIENPLVFTTFSYGQKMFHFFIPRHNPHSFKFIHSFIEFAKKLCSTFMQKLVETDPTIPGQMSS